VYDFQVAKFLPETLNSFKSRDIFIVKKDFENIPKYNLDKVLNIFRINESYIPLLCDAISDLIKNINKWVDLTGGEFLIDTKMFRIIPKYKSSASPNNETKD
jgi:hypothetical protein